jgi:segregation and condensation protein A
MQKERRGNVKKEVKSWAETVNVEAELQNVDLYKLLNVFRNVLSRYEMEKNKPTHRVVEYPYTISGQKEYILEKISLKNKVAFTDLIQDNPSKVAVIFNFLAILELLQNAFVTITIGEGFNNFWLEKLEQE